MSTTPRPISTADLDHIVAALTRIRDCLDHAAEMLAAVHLTHALDCLTARTEAGQ